MNNLKSALKKITANLTAIEMMELSRHFATAVACHVSENTGLSSEGLSNATNDIFEDMVNGKPI